MKKAEKIMLLCLLGLCLLSLVRFFDNTDSLLVDIISHFPVQYALAALGLLAVCVWKKAFRLGVLAGIIFVFNISSIVEPVNSIMATPHKGKSFFIYSANLHLKNDDISKLTREVLEMDPEIVLLLEVTPEHLKQLGQLMERYPYGNKKIFSGKLEIGFVFLSRFPVLGSELTRLSDVCNFILEATLEVDEKQVKFFGIHAQRPGIQNFSERKDQFLELAYRLKSQTLPVIVAGDFNATPYSPTLRRLIEISGLRDSRTGFGWQPSWPTYVPLFWIPIDQILLSPGIQVHNRATGSYIGSDHYPVFAELSISN